MLTALIPAQSLFALMTPPALKHSCVLMGRPKGTSRLSLPPPLGGPFNPFNRRPGEGLLLVFLEEAPAVHLLCLGDGIASHKLAEI